MPLLVVKHSRAKEVSRNTKRPTTVLNFCVGYVLWPYISFVQNLTRQNTQNIMKIDSYAYIHSVYIQDLKQE